MKKNLMENYKEWRRICEEMLEDGYTGSIDCGEKSVREDFSEFAKLDQEISFEEMFELEKEYEDMEEDKKEWIEQEEKEIEKALAFAEGKRLHISKEDIVFTDTVPGEKCNNGGQYGFYTRYSPIPGHPGIYRVYTESTCDFDACGTGYEGIRALTTGEYRRLKKASDKIEAAGSLY